MRELDKVLENDEQILWEGKPLFGPYLFMQTRIYIWIFPFFLFLIFYLLMQSLFRSQQKASAVSLVLLGMLAIFLVLPLWSLLSAAFQYKHTYYAITNKRVIIQTGVIGRDFQMVDFEKITNIGVRVGFWDKVLGGTSGSILVSTGSGILPRVLWNVPQPYEVSKIFKKAMRDR